MIREREREERESAASLQEYKHGVRQTQTDWKSLSGFSARSGHTEPLRVRDLIADAHHPLLGKIK